MKILFDCHLPFLLAHGGAQVLIDQTMCALREENIAVEPLRWWDSAQEGNIIQFFGRASPGAIQFAHAKGIKYVMFELLTSQGSRSKMRLSAQGAVTQVLKRVIPGVYRAAFGWDSYHLADALLASTSWEAEVMQILFQADAAKIHVVPNGVALEFFQAAEEIASRSTRLKDSKWLVCLATITERKRVVEMCQMAIEAGTPLWVIGKPYADDEYTRQFLDLVRKSNGVIRYEGAITEPSDLAPILKASRGFVLLSSMETQSVAASAAAAAGCPLFLSDLPWARYSFGAGATYCPVNQDTKSAAALLKTFYLSAPGSQNPPSQPTWQEIAKQLERIYKTLLGD
jgi:glycosyltransferase involved in cell wall biosynthesis